MKEVWCALKKKMCKFGGTKAYNYGFMSGRSSYCFYDKKWIHDINECPLTRKDKP